MIAALNRAIPATDAPDAPLPASAAAPLRLFSQLLFLENGKQLHRAILIALAKLPQHAQPAVADCLTDMAAALAAAEGGEGSAVLPLAEPFASVIAMHPPHAAGARGAHPLIPPTYLPFPLLLLEIE